MNLNCILFHYLLELLSLFLNYKHLSIYLIYESISILNNKVENVAC